MVSYAFWEDSDDITTKIGRLDFDTDGTSCKSSKIIDYYVKQTIMNTKRSPWPHNEDSVCAWKYTFINDDIETKLNVEIYTDSFNGALASSRPILTLALAVVIITILL